MDIKNFAANSFKTLRALPLAAKIIISVVTLGAILNLTSRYNNYKYGKEITPHKQTVNVERVPAEVREFLSNENLLEMDQSGMNIYTGNNPPNIEGSYDIKNFVIKYDSQGARMRIVPYNVKFTDQSNNKVTISYKSEKGGLKDRDTGTGKGVFISGAGNCFSVYIDTAGNMAKCKYKSATLFSACKSEKGFIDIDMGDLMTHRGKDCSTEEVVPEGNLRIFSQTSLAPRVKK